MNMSKSNPPIGKADDCDGAEAAEREIIDLTQDMDLQSVSLPTPDPMAGISSYGAARMSKRPRLQAVDPNNNKGTKGVKRRDDFHPPGGTSYVVEDTNDTEAGIIVDLTQDPESRENLYDEEVTIQDKSSIEVVAASEVSSASEVGAALMADLFFMPQMAESESMEAVREAHGRLKCPHCPRIFHKRFGVERHIRNCH